LLLIVPVGTSLTWHLFQIAANGYVVMAAIVSSLLGIAWVLRTFRVCYDENFNARIVRPIIHFYDPCLVYAPKDCVPKALFDRSRLYHGAPPERYFGEDLVDGKLGKTHMCFSEVTAQRVRLVSGKNGKKERVTTLFKGVFFSADFNKSFSGATFVFPDRAEKWFGYVGQMLQSLEKDYGEIVKLEDPEFERAFVVYSDSQIEARYILTPALMQRLLDFHRRSRRKIQVSFDGRNVNIGISMGTNLFEPRLFRTLLKPSIYEKFWNDLTQLAGIVEELNLNTRIWTKQ
ncbi:MAG: DUF3137 domain-containing protein, partial [Dokdonella sp.]